MQSNALASSGKINVKLQSIDGAVKAHEKSHLLGLGQYTTGGIQYDYLIFSNGEKYAIGGSVGVDLTPVPGDPRATLHKARVIKAASLAPLDPSGADLEIAARAYQMEMQAQREIRKEELERNQKPGITAAGTDAVYQQTIQLPEITAGDITAIPGNPEATIRKAHTIRAAVMEQPLSAYNRQVLVKAYRMETQARRELAEAKRNTGKEIPDKLYA